MIINKTNNKAISKKELVCSNSLTQAFGLMFRRKQNLIMTFKRERTVSLHMFFVFFPIDVLIINKDMKIVDIKRNFKPFTFWNSNKKGKYIVELGVKDEYQLGDKIKLEN